MKIDSLEKLYHDQLASLRHGDERFLDLLPKLVGVATHFELRNWIRESLPHVRERIGRVDQILPDNAIARQGRDSPGVEGLIAEGHVFLERASDPDVIDAGLVLLFQRILSDRMTRCAALRTFALLLGRDGEAEALQRSLDEQAAAEKALTQLALDAVNLDALSSGAR